MTGYRYELMCDEEYQGVGMFHGLSEIEADYEYIEYLEELFGLLPKPVGTYIQTQADHIILHGERTFRLQRRHKNTLRGV